MGALSCKLERRHGQRGRARLSQRAISQIATGGWDASIRKLVIFAQIFREVRSSGFSPLHRSVAAWRKSHRSSDRDAKRAEARAPLLAVGALGQTRPTSAVPWQGNWSSHFD